MRLQKIYDTLVEIGMKNDPRSPARIKSCLKSVKKQFESLPARDKASFDKETLTNPYDDTRILYGAGSVEVKTIFLGIDMETPELLLADRLKAKGRRIDLVLTHHPEGKALASFYEVMHLQSDLFAKFGVPITLAESLTDDRISEVKRSISAANHMRAVDAARLLDIPYMCAHTVSDNCVSTFLQGLFDKERPETASDALDIVKDIPEYRDAAMNKTPPTLLLGSGSRSTGKIFVDMTGGTEGPKEIFSKLQEAGVGTLVCMHLSEEHYKKAKDAHVNVIIAGHIASDSLGLNIMLDQLAKAGSIDCIPCSGFKRIKR